MCPASNIYIERELCERPNQLYRSTGGQISWQGCGLKRQSHELAGVWVKETASEVGRGVGYRDCLSSWQVEIKETVSQVGRWRLKKLSSKLARVTVVDK